MIKCAICGEEFDESEVELINLEGEEVYVCNDCLEELTQCANCDEYHNSDNMTYIHNEDAYVCDSCLANDYMYCENCGNYYHRDYMNYSERYDDYICDNCYEKLRSEVIKGYHDRDIDIHFKYSSKERQETNYEEKYKLKFGFELEVENFGNYNNNDIAKYIRDNYEELELVFEEDGSLSDGFEIISQPMTMGYIKENREKFKEILQYLSEHNFKSHNTDTCGLHIHFSREYFGNDEENCIDKLMYFFENYKKEIQTFSRRRNYNYCSFITDEYPYKNNKYLDKAVKSMEVVKELKKNYYGHGVAINLSNSATIEIRIFKGTLKYESFMSCIEFVNNLVRNIKETKKLSTLSWESVINSGGKYLKNYVNSMGIVNKNKLKDNTEELKNEFDLELNNLKEKFNKLDNNIKTLVLDLKSYIIDIDFEKEFKDIYQDLNLNHNLTSLIKNLVHSSMINRASISQNPTLFSYIFNNGGLENVVRDSYSSVISRLGSVQYDFSSNSELFNKINDYIKLLRKEMESDN